MSERSILEIDLSRLVGNVHHWRALLRPSQPSQRWPRVCGVVKANAYGFGAPEIATRLSAAGVNQLCVYSPAEAEEVIAAGVNANILVLQIMPRLPLGDGLIQAARKGRLQLSVDDLRQIRMVESFGRALGCQIPVHLHIDTGMSRGGLTLDQFASALDRLRHFKFVQLAGVYSHMATARQDPHFAAWQADQFDLILDSQRPNLPIGLDYHLASTFAACRSRRYHRSMVRVGLGLYGFGRQMIEDDHAVELPSDAPPLQPVLRWTSSVIHMQQYPAGTSVGYDRSHTLQRDSLIGVIPVGYGDGYPLGLSHNTVVCISNGQAEPPITVPVVGRINMDQMTVDLTDAQKQLESLRIGTKVQLISDDPQSPCALHRVADRAQTSCYEILCRLSPRLPRRFVNTQTSVQKPAQTRAKPFVHHMNMPVRSSQPARTARTAQTGQNAQPGQIAQPGRTAQPGQPGLPTRAAAAG